MNNVIFCTTCKGRAQHIKKTLPANLKNNQHGRFLLLDYGSNDGLVEWLREDCLTEIESGKLIVYSFNPPGAFHMAHAKNMAARLAILEGADILVTQDADNFTGVSLDQYAAHNLKESGVVLRTRTIKVGDRRFLVDCYGNHSPHKRGVAGRLLIRAHDFIKMGGYDEKYNKWGAEDIDLNARMERLGYIAKDIDPKYLDAVPHGADIRFKEWPEAREFENDAVGRRIYNAKNTLVNYGNIGCGVAYKNFSDVPATIKPIPTRVFGIGLHKTATSSLHKAFQILGFDSLHWGKGEAPKVWNEMNSYGASRTLEKFYAASDLPIPLLYQKLDKAYSNSKFILTIRDEIKWLKSVAGLYDPNINPTRWVWDKYPITNNLHRTLYGRIDFDPETMLARYRQHNAEVIDYFRGREDLLIMDMETGAGWGDLCKFLDQPVPNMSYPREYITKSKEVELTSIQVKEAMQMYIDSPWCNVLVSI